MELTGKKVTVIGAGKSGKAAAQLIVRLGGEARISDQGISPEACGRDFLDWAEQKKIDLELAGHTRPFLETSDLVVLSPGVDQNALPVQWAKEKNIPVIGEIELASRFCSKPIIAVTGSNGKTTVVTLLKEILNKAGKKACLCGNVGSPFTQYVLDLDDVDYVVLEVSSFQLETIETFKPQVAVFLNVSQNHLDRHSGMDEYFALKKRIFANQDSRDFAVLNAQDPLVRELASELKSQIVFFNEPDNTNGSSLENPNYSAVLTIANILKINSEICDEVFQNFKGVEHRLEWVRSLNGIDFVNDSKCTTAQAGLWAMARIDQPILMICGGRDKNIDFSVIEPLVKEKVKKIFVIGEAREKISQTLAEATSVETCTSLESAVQKAKESAVDGDCVLLSPMCTSFDMFKNFEERGRVFKQIVANLN